jgi:proteasome lid subunit RPN8/RPN11
MGIMKIENIPQSLLKQIFEQAEREYPSECCGMILGPSDKPDALTRIRPLRNVQDEYHKRDPENFPRTAQTAYFMDSTGLLRIHKEARQTKEEIKIIYHSHIDTGAYLSEEDKRIALSEEEPVYPGVAYLVISVIKGKAAEWNLFEWDSSAKDFSKSLGGKC